MKGSWKKIPESIDLAAIFLGIISKIDVKLNSWRKELIFTRAYNKIETIWIVGRAELKQIWTCNNKTPKYIVCIPAFNLRKKYFLQFMQSLNYNEVIKFKNVIKFDHTYNIFTIFQIARIIIAPKKYK